MVWRLPELTRGLCEPSGLLLLMGTAPLDSPELSRVAKDISHRVHSREAGHRLSGPGMSPAAAGMCGTAWLWF